MRIGVLTGGGDTSALNATIYGIVKGAGKNNQVLGFRYGWKGTIEPDHLVSIRNINQYQGGTILKTSRTKLNDEQLKVAAEYIEGRVDAFIAIGGDDTLSVGRKLDEMLSIPICLITKTIDNDVGKNAPAGKEADLSKIVNYFTPGFATAAKKIADYVNELKTTAQSHDRVMFVEAMGRKPGWLALASYKAEPDFIITPERELNYEHFLEQVSKVYKHQKNAIVVVAEGARYTGSKVPIAEDEKSVDSFGHKKLGGVAKILADRVKKDLGIENCNDENPNYLYRCGSPSITDRKYAIQLGECAAKAILGGTTGRVAVLERVGDNLKAVMKDISDVLEIDNNGRIVPRMMDPRFYDDGNYRITDLGRKYFGPINNEGKAERVLDFIRKLKGE
jgi:6-phosphofructokinase 1